MTSLTKGRLLSYAQRCGSSQQGSALWIMLAIVLHAASAAQAMPHLTKTAFSKASCSLRHFVKLLLQGRQPSGVC